ncbi:MAG: hybrid sensor histidine kinase/response regulator [Proteobacteria bacterium]|nr:hybrid sensor histidine kinase/response regulator [Pseudomonadota bacterium]
MSEENRSFHILIVDDVLENIQVLGTTLRKEEYQISAAQSGLKALEMIGEVTPDLILLDVMMPELDGFEICRRLKANPETKDIPVIFITARTETEDIVGGFELGAVDYVTKPFNSSELLSRVNTHLQLKKTRSQLVESEKMAALGGLVAGVAHEINTPVGIAVTAASHLDEKSREIADTFHSGAMKRSDLEKYLRISTDSSRMILSNLKRAADIIQSFKQVAVDQSSEERRIFKLKEYIEDVLLSLRPRLKKTKHEVTITCPDDLELDSFPGAFSQIVTNLVMNSLIHGFDNKEDGEIALEVSDEGNTVQFRYDDDGKGMDKEQIEKVFDPFFTTKRSSGGSGLGMHVVYNLVTQTLKGQIECRSELDQGTTFFIRIPKREENYVQPVR